MAKRNSDLKSLSEIFTDKSRFIIPDYQRGYSWGEEQLEALWEDLENIPDNRDHYTGMFTFNETDEEGVYYVVDGQQRLTTFIILINEILKVMNGGIAGGKTVPQYIEQYLYFRRYGESYNKYRFQYSADDPSDAYFKTEILGQSYSGAANQPAHTLYTNNLRFARNTFRDKIKDYNQDELKNLFLKVTTRLKFNEYFIDDPTDVYVTFETMNNRGKKLSTLELLKNRLIYLTTLFEAKSNAASIQNDVKNLRIDINNSWKTVYRYLGKNPDRKLNDDNFLRDHWIMYFHYDRGESNVFKKELLSEIFTAKQVLKGQLTLSQIKDYVINLQLSIGHWFNINCPDESSLVPEEKMWLRRLNRVGIGSFRPLLMAAFLKRNPEDDMLELLRACERFRFLIFNVSGRRSNTSDYHFYRCAHDFFVGDVNFSTIEALTNDVNGQTRYWLNIDNFILNAVDRYEKREGFYSWSGLRYFLYEYERYLQFEAIGHDKKVSWDSFEHNQKNKISIEHIYPQTDDDSYWTSRFITGEDKGLVHSLGNLLLLSVSKNSHEQNYGFDVKKKTTYNDRHEIIHHGYDDGSHSEIRVSAKAEWTPSEIIERGKLMLIFLRDYWRIQDFTDKQVFTNDQINLLLNIKTSTSSPGQPGAQASSATAVEDVPDWEVESKEDE